jgi:hypothetical protein
MEARELGGAEIGDDWDAVQIDVNRVPRGPMHPGQERGRALHHPRLGLGDKDAGKEPVVGELTLEVGELRPGAEPTPAGGARP